MVLIMKYITMIVWVAFFLSGCKSEFKYSFDLIKMERSKIKNTDLYVMYNPEATPVKRKLGATIVNGPPFIFTACILNEKPKIFEVKKIDFYKRTGKENTYIDSVININSEFIDMGKISCAYEIIEFDDKIEDEEEYCIDTLYSLGSKEVIETSCWSFRRETGDAIMKKEDILNQ